MLVVRMTWCVWKVIYLNPTSLCRTVIQIKLPRWLMDKKAFGSSAVNHCVCVQPGLPLLLLCLPFTQSSAFSPGMFQRDIYTTRGLFTLHICQVCGSFQCPYCPYYNTATSSLHISLVLSLVLAAMATVFSNRLLHR